MFHMSYGEVYCDMVSPSHWTLRRNDPSKHPDNDIHTITDNMIVLVVSCSRIGRINMEGRGLQPAEKSHPI